MEKLDHIMKQCVGYVKNIQTILNGKGDIIGTAITFSFLSPP